MYLQQVRAGQGCPAGSSRGTSVGQGFAERGRWDGCAAGQRRDRLTQCSPLSLQLSLHWGAEAEKTNDTRGTVTLLYLKPHFIPKRPSSIILMRPVQYKRDAAAKNIQKKNKVDR